MNHECTNMVPYESGGERPFRFISEVDRLRMGRDIFKGETDHIVGDFKSDIIKESNEKMEEVLETKELLKLGETMLEQTLAFHKTTHAIFSQTLYVIKNNRQKMEENRKNHTKFMDSTKSSMQKLLQEIKR